ncbi:hypothetical protein Tco_0393506 [Tanacetum coccineum]
MAMLTMGAIRFLKNISRKLTINGKINVALIVQSGVLQLPKKGHFAKEYRALRNQDYKNKESTRRTVHVETSTSIALVSCDGLGGPDEEVSKVVRKSDDYLIIKEWVSDSEEENVSQTKTKKKTVKPSIAKIEFVKPKQQEKTARKTVKQVEKHRQNTHSPRGNQRNWNNMMSQRLGKLIFRDDLIYGPVM